MFDWARKNRAIRLMSSTSLVEFYMGNKSGFAFACRSERARRIMIDSQNIHGLA